MSVPSSLDGRFRETAVRAGLLQAGYDIVDTPVGALFVAATDRGLLRISFDQETDEQVQRLAALVGPRVLRARRQVDPVRRQLDEYFEGRRRRFDLSLDLRGLTPFSERVLDELARVPFGETSTYARLAARSGNPRAARAVGAIMNRNPVPIVLPCHRVVGSNGGLVGYAGGLERKERLLRLEGVLL